MMPKQRTSPNLLERQLTLSNLKPLSIVVKSRTFNKRKVDTLIYIKIGPSC